MTWDQCATCIALEKQGFIGVPLPGDAVPGYIMLADPTGTKLMLVQGDGTVVDLLAVHAAAEDTVRNWHKGSSTPQFVGDFGRLTVLAQALNGRKVLP